MSFADTLEQTLIRRTVEGFVAREPTPEYPRELDATARAPHELLPKMAALGYTGMPEMVPENRTGG